MEVANSHSTFEESQPGLSRKSSSEEEESNGEEEEEVPDYLDKAGRRWHFLVHAKEEEDLAQFCQQNGLVPGNENGKRRKFGCSRPECHFRAVFLKANSGIYTQGEHWHEQLDGQKRKKLRDLPNERIIYTLSGRSKIISREKEEIYINIKGKEFKLVHRFETDYEFEKYRRENWLMKSGNGNKRMKYNDRTYLRCKRAANELSTNCRVIRIYVKHNRSLYQNSEQHNHPFEKENELDYMDRKGQCWHFLCQMNNFGELEKYAKEHMLYLYGNNKRKLFLFMCKFAHPATLKQHPYPPPYCKMKAIFVKATSSIYVRNEHSHHPAFKINSISTRSGHGRTSKYFSKYEAEKKAGKYAEQQIVPMPKEEADSAGDEEGQEVRIVKHLQRDYKCLGRMKREEEEGQSRTNSDSRADHTIQLDDEEEDLEEGTSQGTRGWRRRGTFYRYPQRELQRPTIKKEEPEEEAEPAEDAPLPVPQPQLPANIAWLQQFRVARPAKMLLRERKKRINYGK